MFGDINAFLESGSNVVIAIPEIGVVANSDIAYDINTGTEIPDRTAFTYLQEANVGAFQVGFFPIMMFGLPAVGLAIASQADKDYRKSVYAFMITAAAVSFLTGITEPLEFSFMFVSPLLYLAYALLSGVVGAITIATGASFGFGFSAGAIDFGLSVPNSLNLSHGISSYANG
jgi:PTS system N-acetylglucosamine-specific IIC component